MNCTGSLHGLTCYFLCSVQFSHSERTGREWNCGVIRSAPVLRACDGSVTMQRACENFFFFVNVRNCRPVHELKAPWFTGERITTERNWHPVHELWTKRDHADEWTNLDKQGHTVSLGCRAFSSRSAVTHNCFNGFSSTFTFHLDYKLSFCCTLQMQGLCLPVLLSNCPKKFLFCASLSLPWIRIRRII